MEVKATGERLIEEFDTVLIAIGREPSTRNLNLDKVGVQLNDEGKVRSIDTIRLRNTRSLKDNKPRSLISMRLETAKSTLQNSCQLLPSQATF